MNLRRVSGIARPLDFGYPSNRWIAAVAVGVLAAAWLLRGLLTEAWLAAGADAGLAALAVFLAWALCRELDPDLVAAALVAAGLCALALGAAALLRLGPPALAPLFAVLLAMRVLNRTTGVPATPADVVGLLGLAVWLALRGDWLYLGLGIAAVLIDGVMSPRSLRRLLMLGAASVAAIGGAWLAGQEPAALRPASNMVAIVLAVGLSLLLLPSLSSAGTVTTVADDTGERLQPMRVRAGQGLALAAGIGAAVEHGSAGLTDLLPLWAAIIADGGYRLVVDRANSRSASARS